MSPETRPWLIAAAVEQEIGGIRSGLQTPRPLPDRQGNAWTCEWRGRPLLLVRTGVGPERVRKGLSPFLTEDGCRAIVSTGYAGALKKEYKLGDILVPTEVQSVPPLREVRFQPDPALRERVVERVRTGPWRLHTDRMITSERVIFSSREKQGLGLTYDAGSVEMESAVIAELAEEASLPWIVVRVVLDEASFALPDVMQVLRWRRKKQYGKIIAHVATHPYQWVEAVRLLQRSRRASRALKRLFLERLLDGLVEMG